ncbi:cupin domain-containing protein [Pseudomonas cavernae]|uniref:Cupin domain-containing protein n=1 Tax=Pseudomonas cavernae TaxID=2320867 RepID=A0A385Z117_9PSED|nr:cupin domain-containing protein [Pseudomonas cavernae]AYC32361.1 cupin domain-containing protein [Pseudomonas cavernae]
MTTTRIVTGHDSSGSSTIISSGSLAGAEEFTHSPGFSAAVVWQTSPVPDIADRPKLSEHPARSVIPAPGGTTALLVTFPPDSLFASPDFDPAAAAGELCERLPGLGELFEADNPGFHRTDSIDYGIVLEGEITLELDQQSHHLRQGDIVVQGGTRHAWRNPGSKPARLLFVLVGANRPERSG